MIGRLVVIFRRGYRNTVSFRGPGAQVDLFAARGTERPVGVIGAPLHRLATVWAPDDPF